MTSNGDHTLKKEQLKMDPKIGLLVTLFLSLSHFGCKRQFASSEVKETQASNSSETKVPAKCIERKVPIEEFERRLKDSLQNEGDTTGDENCEYWDIDANPKNPELSLAAEQPSEDAFYPNGSAFIFLGFQVGDTAFPESLYSRLVIFTRWLEFWGFDAKFKSRPSKKLVGLALADKRMSSIYWLDHGATNGSTCMSGGKDFLPKDSFDVAKPVLNWKLFLSLSCYGKRFPQYYLPNKERMFPNLVTLGWDTEIFEHNAFTYLESDVFVKKLSEVFGKSFKRNLSNH